MITNSRIEDLFVYCFIYGQIGSRNFIKRQVDAII
jgi:hypothetical protein